MAKRLNVQQIKEENARLAKDNNRLIEELHDSKEYIASLQKQISILENDNEYFRKDIRKMVDQGVSQQNTIWNLEKSLDREMKSVDTLIRVVDKFLEK